MTVTKERRRCIVVGAGITGLSTAILLLRSQPDIDVEIWEAAEQVGGLLAPLSFEGVACDRGSHRIHPQAHPLLFALTRQQEWQRRPRNGRLILNGHHLQYPPKMGDFLRGLGWQTGLQMGWGFATRPRALQQFLNWEQDRRHQEDDDEGFETFVLERVGQAAYEQFYRPYVEKVWGLSPSQISRTVAKQRVSTSSPWQTLLGAVSNRFQPAAPHFLYPRQGMAALLDHLHEQARAHGATIQLGKQVTRKTLQTTDASAIFYSGHLSDITETPGLSHRGLYLLYLAFPRGSIADIDTFYAPESDYWFGRVSQPEQFSGDLRHDEKQVLCVEIPEGRWGPEQSFDAQLPTICHQLQQAGILPHNAPLLAHQQLFLPRVYPMYTRGWVQQWQQAIGSLHDLPPLYPIGRQGLFLHCNMDHCVRMAQEAVLHFTEGKPAVEWHQQVHRYLDLRVRD